jgi:uncharacterized protein YdeI (YjbR/CyaY-like superfamily)
MEIYKDLPVVLCEKPDEWAKWIEENPDANGVWLKFAKKGTGVSTIDYHQALEVALCYGWIDTMANKLDEVYYLQKFTPRRAKSVWSVRNTKLAEDLIKAGKMKPSGQAEIDRAKADGRWDAAYETSSNSEIPQDFLDRLQKNKKAYEFYQTLTKANLFAIYYRLHTAKKPETRERRIQQIIDMLETGKKFH